MTSAAAVQATAAVVTAGGIASLTYLAGSAGLAASRVNPDPAAAAPLAKVTGV